MSKEEKAYWDNLCAEYEAAHEGATYLREDKLEHDIERLCA